MSGTFIVGFLIGGFAVASAVYLIALKCRLMAVTDLLWTSGLGVGSLLLLTQVETVTARSLAVIAIIAIWSGRISWFLLKNRVIPRVEDGRYERLMNHWGSRAKRNFYFLFLTQIVLAGLFLPPVYAAMANTAPWGAFDWVALAIAFVAISGETIADAQLARFRSNPSNKAKVCRDGFWKYSRHPNYFFEWLHWLAYVAFAWGSPAVPLAVAGPVLMYIFLRWLTGVPHAERQSLASRGDAYRDYQQTTNAFWPWIPRKLSD